MTAPLTPRLPHVVAPHADESFLGVLTRTVERNALWGPGPIIDLMAAKPRTLAKFPFDQEAITSFADLVAMDRQTAFPLAHVLEDGRRHLRGHPVRVSFLSTTTMSFCPACLGETCYHRAHWALSILPVCARHGCLLVSVCEQCGVRQDWQRASLGSCRCGFDLRRSRQAAAPTGLPFARHVIKALDLSSTEPVDALIAKVGVDGVLEMVYDVGWHVMGWKAPQQPAGFGLREPVKMLTVMDAGWRACCDLPGSFTKALEEIRLRVVERMGPQDSVENSFEGLPRWIKLVQFTKWGQILNRVFIDYAANRTRLSTSIPEIVAAMDARSPRFYSDA